MNDRQKEEQLTDDPDEFEGLRVLELTLGIAVVLFALGCCLAVITSKATDDHKSAPFLEGK